MSYHEKIVTEERKRVSWRIWLIDFLLLYYFGFGVFVFLTRGLELFKGLEQSPNAVYAIIFGLSVGLTLLWQRAGNSVGRILVYRTNKILKGVKNLSQEFKLKSPAGIFTLAVVFLTFILGWLYTEISFYKLFSYEGMLGAQRIFSSIFRPNWDIFGMVVDAMVETIFIAFMATFIAIPIAFVGSFFAARNLMKDTSSGLWVYTVIRVICNFTRSVEPLIWAIIFSVWVGIGPFAGMMALMLHSVASLIKLYSEQIESINRGPMEAMEATGANRVLMVWYAVVPQVVMPFLSYTIYRWDINIRMATIIGLVGGGGVGTLLMQYQGLAQWNEVGTIVLVIAVVVWLMDYLSAKIREAIY